MSCEEQGGNLLKMNNQLKPFLKNAKKTQNHRFELVAWIRTKWDKDGLSEEVVQHHNSSEEKRRMKMRRRFDIHVYSVINIQGSIDGAAASFHTDVIAKLMTAAKALTSPIHNYTVSRILNGTTAFSDCR
ncbi:hypothetical protein WMY93_013447 [Mugilogobius chulae]|uniref:Uncharacterized protein n=1 Tax=Mugilogobius chulae TaxID=88201 RepID=A0AAW0NZZ5_9GOBI